MSSDSPEIPKEILDALKNKGAADLPNVKAPTPDQDAVWRHFGVPGNAPSPDQQEVWKHFGGHGNAPDPEQRKVWQGNKLGVQETGEGFQGNGLDNVARPPSDPCKIR